MNQEKPKSKPEPSASALAHGPALPDARKSAVELVTSHDPNLTAKDGAEAAVARFCDQAFINPESARTGSAALLEAFDDSGLWLASLVHPHQLLSELRHSSSTLARVIITQWTRQGETHKLVRLGTALLEANPPATTHEAGQIAALLASLLGILRPSRAQDLLEMARPLLKDSVDPHLLREACDWVDVGRILEPMPAEDRFFWNRRLREPGNDWDWDTPEARDALRRLAPILTAAGDDTDLSRFQEGVPACWWDLLHERPKAAVSSARLMPYQIEAPSSYRSLGGFAQLPPPDAPLAAAPSRIGIYAIGVLTGLACMALFIWLNRTHTVPAVLTQTAAPAPATAAPAIPVATAPVAVARAPRPPPPPVTESLVKPTTPQTIKRQAAVVEIAERYPHLQRLHHLAATGSLRENEPLLNGQSTLSQSDYGNLIRWLMLDPPERPEVRLAVAKVAARTLPPKELLPTLSLCIYPDSPNTAEARQCARWAMELNQETLNAQERQRLESLNSPLAQNAN